MTAFIRALTHPLATLRHWLETADDAHDYDDQEDEL